MVKTISTNDSEEYESLIETFEAHGYKVSSTSCGYTGEVGNSVYDCEYWMAVLVKELDRIRI